MTAPLRVGFLGGGLIARWHAAVLNASGEPVARSGVFDPDRERAAEFETRTGWPALGSEAEVIDASDAVYVCTWTSEHPRLAGAVADAGRALFCEKPLAVDLSGARAVASSVRTARVPNQVGLVLRHSPAFAALRSLVQAPEAGRLMSIVFRDDQYIPVTGTYRSTWRADARRAGAGALLEHSIHDVDLLEHLGGPVAAVTASTANFHGHPGIEDLAVATVRFASGAVGALTSVWHDVWARPSLRRVEVFCERRVAVLEHDWFGPVRWTDPDGAEGVLEGEALVAAARPELPSDVLPDAAFVRAVRDGRPAWPDVDVAVRAHVLVDALYRSARAGGGPVAVPDPGHYS